MVYSTVIMKMRSEDFNREPRAFWSVNLNIHIHLVPMLRIHGSWPPKSYTPSWRCVRHRQL